MLSQQLWSWSDYSKCESRFYQFDRKRGEIPAARAGRQVDRRRLPSMQQTGDPDVLCRRTLAINNVLSDLRLLLFADGCFLLSNNLRMSPGRRFKLVTAFSSDYDVGQLCAKVKM